MTDTPSYSDYPVFLAALKDRVLQARTSAVRAVNIWRMRAFYLAYFNGDTILAQAAPELNGAIPHASPKPILAQAAPELAEPSAILLGIPWGHNITLIQKLKGSLPTIAEIEKELGPA